MVLLFLYIKESAKMMFFDTNADIAVFLFLEMSKLKNKCPFAMFSCPK